MIQQVKIDQALLGLLVGANLGLPIAHENLEYNPVIGVPYLEPIIVVNDLSRAAYKELWRTDGVFRIIVRYPLDKGAIEPKKIIDQILSIFPLTNGIPLTNGRIQFTRLAREKGVPEPAWHKQVATVYFTIFISED